MYDGDVVELWSIFSKTNATPLHKCTFLKISIACEFIGHNLYMKRKNWVSWETGSFTEKYPFNQQLKQNLDVQFHKKLTLE